MSVDGEQGERVMLSSDISFPNEWDCEIIPRLVQDLHSRAIGFPDGSGGMNVTGFNLGWRGHQVFRSVEEVQLLFGLSFDEMADIIQAARGK